MLIELQLHLAGNFIIPVTVKPCMDLLWVSSRWHRWKRATLAELEESTSESRLSWSKYTGRLCEGKSVLKENLLFFLSQNNFGNLNFHQCKCVSLFCSETNWYHVTPLSCYSATSHPISSWPRERSQRTESSASSCAPGRASLSKAWPERLRETPC